MRDKNIERKGGNVQRGEIQSRNEIKDLARSALKGVEASIQDSLIKAVVERLRELNKLDCREEERNQEERSDLIASLFTEELDKLSSNNQNENNVEAGAGENVGNNLDNKDGETVEQPIENPVLRDRDESEALEGQDSRFKKIAEHKITKVTVGALYKTVGSISGTKFVADLGLTLTAGAGHLLARMVNSRVGDRIENSVFMGAVKSNDVYSYLHDSFAETGARKTRQNLKSEFASLPAGVEQVVNKVDILKTKIENNPKLTPEQKEEYLNKVKLILEDSANKSEDDKYIHRQKLEKLTEAYVSNQVSAMHLTKDVLNLGFTATGLLGLRAISYFGISVAQRMTKASTEYEKMLDPEKTAKGIDSKSRYMFKDTVINSTKETLNELSFAAKDNQGNKLSKVQRLANFIKSAGTIARIVGIGSHAAEGPDLAPLLKTIGGNGDGTTLEYFQTNLANNLHRASFGILGHSSDRAIEPLISHNESLDKGTIAQDQTISGGFGHPSDSTLSRIDSSYVSPSDSVSLGHNNIEVGITATNPVISEAVVNSEADYLNNDPVLAKNIELKGVLMGAKILNSGTIEDRGSISQALGHGIYNNIKVTFIQPDGQSIESGAGEVFVHPGDKVIETDQGIFVIKDSGVKGEDVSKYFEAKEVNVASSTNESEISLTNKELGRTIVSGEGLVEHPDVYEKYASLKLQQTANGTTFFNQPVGSLKYVIKLDKFDEEKGVFKEFSFMHNGKNYSGEIAPGDEANLAKIVQDKIGALIKIDQGLNKDLVLPDGFLKKFSRDISPEEAREIWDSFSDKQREFYSKFDGWVADLLSSDKSPEERIDAANKLFSSDGRVTKIRILNDNDFSVVVRGGKEVFIRKSSEDGSLFASFDKNFNLTSKLIPGEAQGINELLKSDIPQGFLNDFYGRGVDEKSWWIAADDSIKEFYKSLGNEGLPKEFMDQCSKSFFEEGRAPELISNEWMKLSDDAKKLYQEFGDNLKFLNSDNLNEKRMAVEKILGQEIDKINKGVLGRGFSATLKDGTEVFFKPSGQSDGGMLMSVGSRKFMSELDVNSALEARTLLRPGDQIAEAANINDSDAVEEKSLLKEIESSIGGLKSGNKAEVQTILSSMLGGRKDFEITFGTGQDGDSFSLQFKGGENFMFFRRGESFMVKSGVKVFPVNAENLLGIKKLLEANDLARGSSKS